jgi:hypothetical protein
MARIFKVRSSAAFSYYGITPNFSEVSHGFKINLTRPILLEYCLDFPNALDEQAWRNARKNRPRGDAAIYGKIGASGAYGLWSAVR